MDEIKPEDVQNTEAAYNEDGVDTTSPFNMSLLGLSL